MDRANLLGSSCPEGQAEELCSCRSEQSSCRSTRCLLWDPQGVTQSFAVPSLGRSGWDSALPPHWFVLLMPYYHLRFLQLCLWERLMQISTSFTRLLLSLFQLSYEFQKAQTVSHFPWLCWVHRGSFSPELRHSQRLTPLVITFPLETPRAYEWTLHMYGDLCPSLLQGQCSAFFLEACVSASLWLLQPAGENYLSKEII